MRPAPPRGMSTSTSPFIFISSFALSREVSSIRFTVSAGSPAFSTAARMRFATALFEFIASLPPRSMTALPALRQRAAASEVTFGLASYIIPITPSGTVTFSILSPFGLVEPERTLPTGSGIAATSSTPFAMPSMRSAVRVRRSIIDSAMPFSRAAAISARFASNMLCTFSRRADEISLSAASRFAPPARASSR